MEEGASAAAPTLIANGSDGSKEESRRRRGRPASTTTASSTGKKKSKRSHRASGDDDTIAAIARELAEVPVASAPEPGSDATSCGGRAVDRNGLARAVKLKPGAEGRVLFNDASRRRNCDLPMPATVQRRFSAPASSGGGRRQPQHHQAAAFLPADVPAAILKLLGKEQGERFFLSDEGARAIRALLLERCEAGAQAIAALDQLIKGLRGEHDERRQQLEAFKLPTLSTTTCQTASNFELRSAFVEEHGQRVISVLDQLRWLGVQDPINFWTNFVKPDLEKYVKETKDWRSLPIDSLQSQR
jgi:hypothetical protein